MPAAEGSTPEVMIKEIYPIILPNGNLVEGHNLERKEDYYRFCSEDPGVVFKSYLEGSVINIEPSLETGDLYLNLSTERYTSWGVLIEKGDFSSINILDNIAVPTIRPLDRLCSDGSGMYKILRSNDTVDPSTIIKLRD